MRKGCVLERTVGMAVYKCKKTGTRPKPGPCGILIANYSNLQ